MLKVESDHTFMRRCQLMPLAAVGGDYRDAGFDQRFINAAERNLHNSHGMPGSPHHGSAFG